MDWASAASGAPGSSGRSASHRSRPSRFRRCSAPSPPKHRAPCTSQANCSAPLCWYGIARAANRKTASGNRGGKSLAPQDRALAHLLVPVVVLVAVTVARARREPSQVVEDEPRHPHPALREPLERKRHLADMML